MADKMTCPACDAHTSSVLAAYRDGDPCPYCNLPHAALRMVVETQQTTAFRVKLAQWFANRRVGGKATNPNEDDWALADALIASGIVRPVDSATD